MARFWTGIFFCKVLKSRKITASKIFETTYLEIIKDYLEMIYFNLNKKGQRVQVPRKVYILG